MSVCREQGGGLEMDRMSTYENSIYYTVSRQPHPCRLACILLKMPAILFDVWVAFFSTPVSRQQRYIHCCRQAGDANRPGELTRDSTLAGSVAAAPKATATALPVVSRKITLAVCC